MATATRHVGETVELTASFTLDGEPADPDTVTIQWRAPDGTISDPVNASRTSEGEFYYDLLLDAAGEWRWEFTGTGDAGGVQGGALRAHLSLLEVPTAEVVCGISEVEERLQRTLTLAEATNTKAMIAQLVDVLELRLNRCIYPRQITETHLLPVNGRLRLRKAPVRSVTSIVESGVPLAAGDPRLAVWETAGAFLDGVEVTVVYQAGDDVRPAMTGLIADVVARSIQAGVAAGSGAVKSYSVEGTSITYGDVGDGGQGGSGRLKVGDLRSVGRLRRPVLLT